MVLIITPIWLEVNSSLPARRGRRIDLYQLLDILQVSACHDCVSVVAEGDYRHVLVLIDKAVFLLRQWQADRMYDSQSSR